MNGAVRQDVCPFESLFLLCSHHHITMPFLRVMTLFKINLGAKDQGHKSKIKVTEVKSVFFLILDDNYTLN